MSQRERALFGVLEPAVSAFTNIIATGNPPQRDG
jgi:hypothetical protein